MQIPVYSMSGQVVKNIDIADSVFAVPGMKNGLVLVKKSRRGK